MGKYVVKCGNTIVKPVTYYLPFLQQ